MLISMIYPKFTARFNVIVTMAEYPILLSVRASYIRPPKQIKW